MAAPAQPAATATAAAAAAAADQKGDKWIFGQTEDVNKYYQFGKQLGQPGQFGFAQKAQKIGTNEQYAVKVISKARFTKSASGSKDVFEAFRQEVEIMKKLNHKNVIRFFEAFEDKAQLYLVMELCSGGELFDAITARGRYSEKDAAAVLRQAFEGVAYLHSNKIAHCDLKPDNFLFDANAQLKIIDFGMSKYVKRHQYFRKFCGTPYYVAPEVIDGKYNESCDIWSLGVVMFVMLHGYPPFYADPQKYGAQADDQVYRLIKAGFKPIIKDGYGSHFPKKIPVSDSARDLITRLLNPDPLKRLTAKEALEHSWLTGETATDTPLNHLVMKGLLTFNKTNKFKESVLQLMTSDLTQKEIDDLKQTFESMDTNKDGSITLAELKQALEKVNQSLKVEEIAEIMKAADLNSDGVLSYQELMLTYVNRRLNANEERLYHSFCKFDLDGDGKITLAEMKSAFGKEDEKQLMEMIKQVDVDGDGLVDYEEFLAMFRPENASPRKPVVDNKDTTLDEPMHHPLINDKDT